MKLNEAIRKRIFDLCSKNSIAIDDLTMAVGTDCDVLTGILNGDDIVIPLDGMERICTALGSRMQDFFMCNYFENLER